jgi:chromosome segregation ATPase
MPTIPSRPTGLSGAQSIMQTIFTAVQNKTKPVLTPAQYAQLEPRVAQLKTQITQMESKVSDLQNRLAQDKQELARLQALPPSTNRFDSNRSRIQLLNFKISDTQLDLKFAEQQLQNAKRELSYYTKPA